MTGFIQSTIKNPTRSLVLANKGSSVVTTANYLMVTDLSSGLVVDATSGATEATIAGVCNQAISAADALTQVLLIQTFENDEWVVDSTNNSNTAHNGQAMIIGANAYTVNNTGTTSAVGVVVQVGTFGAAADKKIIVRFIK
jgi:hypothetical protein